MDFYTCTRQCWSTSKNIADTGCSLKTSHEPWMREADGEKEADNSGLSVQLNDAYGDRIYCLPFQILSTFRSYKIITYIVASKILLKYSTYSRVHLVHAFSCLCLRVRTRACVCALFKRIIAFVVHTFLYLSICLPYCQLFLNLYQCNHVDDLYSFS